MTYGGRNSPTGESEGFSLRPATHCSVCADFASCFGDEDGMSRLATDPREAPAHGSEFHAPGADG